MLAQGPVSPRGSWQAGGGNDRMGWSGMVNCVRALRRAGPRSMKLGRTGDIHVPKIGGVKPGCQVTGRAACAWERDRDQARRSRSSRAKRRRGRTGRYASETTVIEHQGRRGSARQAGHMLPICFRLAGKPTLASSKPLRRLARPEGVEPPTPRSVVCKRRPFPKTPHRLFRGHRP